MKRILTILFLFILVMMNISCEQKEINKYQIPYVVGEDSSLPYYESQQKYNGTHIEELRSQLASYDNDTEEIYLLVDNSGNIIDDENFQRNKNRTFSDELLIIDQIKNFPLFIVKKDFYYVTTVEKEIEALFKGNRLLFDQEQLDKIIKDNEDAYKKKDYDSILSYLRRNNIRVWKQYVDY